MISNVNLVVEYESDDNGDDDIQEIAEIACKVNDATGLAVKVRLIPPEA